MAAALPNMSAEMAEFFRLSALVKAGHPRPFIERYFKIGSDTGGGLVPMLFENEPNQLYYYSQIQPRLLEWHDTGKIGADGEPERVNWLVDVLTMKDRKARWTSIVSAILAAKMFVKENTFIFWIANSEDTFDVAHRLVDTFYWNMPADIRPEIRGNEWGKERKVLRFPTLDGGEATSTFVIRTAANPNVGSGETPTDVVFDEYGKFPKTFGSEAQASIRAAFTLAAFWRGGTVGPNGPEGPMYDEIQQIKQGRRQTLYLFRMWHQNPANILTPGSRLRRPADMDDTAIKPGVDAGTNGERERVIVSQFPGDGIPVSWRLAWRRAKMEDALLAAGGPGNEDAANILFAREHCEDDETPWLVAGHMQFNATLMEAQLAVAKDPANVPVTNKTIHGLQFRAWRGYDPTHVYIQGMDFGSGTGGDDTSAQIFDATTMTFIGEYHGNVTEPYHAAAGGVIVMESFGNGVWIPETNRFPGIGNHIKKTLGYANTWKPPMRKGESFEAYAKRPYGMYVGATHHSEKEPSAEELLGQFKAMFNNGGFKVLNPYLLEAMRRWNPDRDKHPPDRIAGARLCLLGLDMARRLQPVTGMPKPSPTGVRRREVRRRPAAASGVGVWGIN